MTSAAQPTPFEPSPTGAPFEHIVCGIDASDASMEAVDQAARLVGSGTQVELVAVTNEWRGGRVVPKERAAAALGAAAASFGQLGAKVRSATASGTSPWQTLRGVAVGSDLLVLGRHYDSRAEGIVVGSVGSRAVHSSPVPVLLASPPPAGVAFPENLLVAVDASPQAQAALRTAATIARFTATKLTVLRIEWLGPRTPARLRKAIDEAAATLGYAPEEVVIGGKPHVEIRNFARRNDVSLVVTGSRALHGIPALRSVSERVAHTAPCSVLVVRHDS